MLVLWWGCRTAIDDSAADDALACLERAADLPIDGALLRAAPEPTIDWTSESGGLCRLDAVPTMSSTGGEVCDRFIGADLEAAAAWLSYDSPAAEVVGVVEGVDCIFHGEGWACELIFPVAPQEGGSAELAFTDPDCSEVHYGVYSYVFEASGSNDLKVLAVD